MLSLVFFCRRIARFQLPADSLHSDHRFRWIHTATVGYTLQDPGFHRQPLQTSALDAVEEFNAELEGLFGQRPAAAPLSEQVRLL